MVNLTYSTTLANYSANSTADLFRYAEVAVTGFWSMILLALFFITTMFLYSAGLNRGRGDFIAGATVSAWLVTVIAYMMSLVEGLIGSVPILFAFTGSIILTIFLFMTNQRE